MFRRHFFTPSVPIPFLTFKVYSFAASPSISFSRAGRILWNLYDFPLSAPSLLSIAHNFSLECFFRDFAMFFVILSALWNFFAIFVNFGVDNNAHAGAT